jgi:hypothetical protein
MDIKTALQVLHMSRPVKFDENHELTAEWRNDRNRRKAARRLLATGKKTTSQASKVRRVRSDVMRNFTNSTRLDTWLSAAGETPKE